MCKCVIIMKMVKTKMNYKNPKTKSLNSKVLLLALLIIALVLSGLWIYKNRANDTQFADNANSPGTEKIDLSPPTAEEKAAAESNKDRPTSEQSAGQTPSQSTGKKNATPVIGYIQQADNGDVEANGFISDVSEEGGTCTLNLAKDGKTVTFSKTALPDAQGTVCGLLTINRSKLTTGAWTATITYNSSKYQGTSEEKKIDVN